VDHELSATDAYAPDRLCVSTQEVAALFRVKLCHGLHSEKCEVEPKIRLRQSMRIYLKNNSAKCHPDPTRNDGTLVFFEEVAPTRRATTSYEISS